NPTHRSQKPCPHSSSDPLQYAFKQPETTPSKGLVHTLLCNFRPATDSPGFPQKRHPNSPPKQRE
ncbi:hypothetical protein, partial [Streptomyces noursei]|uniref:hypothetical protein n=1 Tax=Streptomyces noursei TaxID=1971 RepID=UPI0019D6CB1D